MLSYWHGLQRGSWSGRWRAGVARPRLRPDSLPGLGTRRLQLLCLGLQDCGDHRGRSKPDLCFCSTLRSKSEIADQCILVILYHRGEKGLCKKLILRFLPRCDLHISARDGGNLGAGTGLLVASYQYLEIKVQCLYRV